MTPATWLSWPTGTRFAAVSSDDIGSGGIEIRQVEGAIRLDEEAVVPRRAATLGDDRPEAVVERQGGGLDPGLERDRGREVQASARWRRIPGRCR